MNRIDLNGRAAVVTGGAAGLGLGIAKRLVESGADTCIWDVNEDGLAAAVKELSAAADGAKVTGRAADISDNSAVEAAFAGSVGDLGKVDIVVNNAGISGPNITSWEYPIDAWDKVVDINLSGTFYVSRTAIPHMLENGYGRIVNIASIAGKEGNPKAPAYSATKGRRHRLDEGVGQGVGADQRDGQLRDAGGGADGDLRSDDPGAYRFHALEDPHEPLRSGGRDRRHGGMAGLRGMLVRHRRGLRRLGRPRDLLA